MGMIKGVLVGIIVLYVGIMFVVTMIPTLESDISSANITAPMTSSIIDMSSWVIPVLALVGLFMAAFAMFKLGRVKG